MRPKKKLELVVAVLGTVVGILGISLLAGGVPTTLELAVLFATGFGSGASLVAALRRKSSGRGAAPLPERPAPAAPITRPEPEHPAQGGSGAA